MLMFAKVKRIKTAQMIFEILLSIYHQMQGSKFVIVQEKILFK